MNWIKWKLINNEIQKLKETETGKRVLELKAVGEKISYSWVLLKTVLVSLFLAIVVGYWVSFIPDQKEIAVGVAFIIFVVTFVSIPLFFRNRNMKKEEFKKVESELDDLLTKNPHENKLLEKIIKIDSW